MKSSMRVTFRLWVQPVDFHGTWQVSGSSRDGRGPEAARQARMSRRKESLARTQSRYAARHRPPRRGRARPSGPCQRGGARGPRPGGSGPAARSGPGPPARRPGRRVSTRSRDGSRRPDRRSGRRRRPGRAAAGSGGGRCREDLRVVCGPGAGRGPRCGGRRCGRAGGRPPGQSYRQDWAAWRDRPSTKMSMRSSKRSSGSARANSSARSVMVGNSAEGSEAM